MALTFGKINRSAAFNPTTAFPLDARYYFESLESAIVAAESAVEVGSSEGTYFFGENLVVVANGKATLYLIQPDKTLTEVGSVPVGDEQSIQIVNGKVQINGFNDHYYAYSVDEETGTSTYTKTTGFKEGLEPKVIKKLDENGSIVTDTKGNPIYEIAWYEPSTTTVEGLSSLVATLEKSVQDKADKATTLAGYGIEDAYTKDEIDSKLSSVFHYKGSVVNYDALPTENLVVGDVYNVETANAEKGIKAGDNVAWNGADWDILGGTVDLTAYALKTDLDGKVDKVDGSRLMTNAEGTKLENIEENAQVNVIDGVSEEFVISADGKTLSVKEISQEKITGLTEALKKKVDAVEGSRLMTDEEGTKLAGIENNAQANILEVVKLNDNALPITEKGVNIPVGGETLGVVKSSADENKVMIDAEGNMEVNKINVNKLTQTEGETLILNGGSSAN